MDYNEMIELMKKHQQATSAKDFLPRSTRRKLHELGWTTIRNTHLTRVRECGFKHLLSIKGESEHYNLYMVLGIVAHMAGNEYYGRMVMYHDIEDFWLDLYRKWARQEFAAHEKRGDKMVILHRGNVYTDAQVQAVIRQMAKPVFAGLTLGQVIRDTLSPLFSAGHKVYNTEHYMYFIDGKDEYPIKFQGQYDLITMFNGAYFLWDLKFWGMFGTFIDGGLRIKKQDLEEDDCRMSFQHQHYAWLLEKIGHPVPEYYGFLVPTNMVPYTRNGKGYKAGDTRGSPMFYADVPGKAFTRRWERFLKITIESWTDRQLRTFPTSRGENLCKSCQYKDQCLGSSDSVSVRENTFLDYLREEM